MTFFETVFPLFDVCVGRKWNGEVLLAGMDSVMGHSFLEVWYRDG